MIRKDAEALLAALEGEGFQGQIMKAEKWDPSDGRGECYTRGIGWAIFNLEGVQPKDEAFGEALAAYYCANPAYQNPLKEAAKAYRDALARRAAEAR